jgi:predicted dehydrogenase/acetyltransferase-like isoleucine patch superfamily enzyme
MTGFSSNTPRVGLVGCGYWGKNLARNFHELGALAAVCDTDGESLYRAHEAHSVRTAQWDELLDDSGISAVAIATPAETHALLTEQALDAGKHVFIEKPLALRLSEAQTLCEQAERSDRRLMVGHLLQYHPAFLKLKELVREGQLGRLEYIYSNRLNLGRIRREEDILWSFAPHDISMILSLVGTPPEKVWAIGAYYLHKTIADVTTTHLSFPGGEQAHIFVSWLHPYKEQKLVVVGDRGMAVFDDGKPWESKLLLYAHRIGWREGMPLPEKADAEPVVLKAEEPLKEECRHFLDCVASGTRPRTDGREGLNVLRVLDEATRCIRNDAGPSKSPKASSFPDVMIHETACVDQPVDIGAGTKVWHFSHVLSGAKIGRNVIIGQNVMVGPGVSVGDRCKIQNNVSIYQGVTLEDGVFCGPSCVFTNVMTPRAEVERKKEFQPTLVRRGTTIGANATILCGTTLGEYSLVAAGAVVTNDVPPHALVAGVPARRIGWVSHSGERLGSDLVCPREGRQYRECDPDRLEEIV